MNLKNIRIGSAALMAIIAVSSISISGCAGESSGLSATTASTGETIAAVTHDAPVSTALFLGLSPGPVTIRHADGQGAVDHNGVATLKYVRREADEARLGLVETKNGFMVNHGFSGSPVLRGGKVIGGIRQGLDNSSYAPDNQHADIIDISQVIGEYDAARAAKTTPMTTERSAVLWYVPTEVLARTPQWSNQSHRLVGLSAAAVQKMAAAPAPTALTRGGGPYAWQGQGIAFAYSPYIFASGHITFRPDITHLLTLCHGIANLPSQMSLPTMPAFSYRMNDGTMVGLPINKAGFIGTATTSLQYSTVVDLSQMPPTNTTLCQAYDATGNLVKSTNDFLAQDSDVYLVNYANMANMYMAVPRLVAAAFGSAAASGQIKAKLHLPMKTGPAFNYSAGFDGDLDPAFNGHLSDLLTRWMSDKTFDAFYTSGEPILGQATLQIWRTN